jgi:murein L,D-transpeptidase YafK
MLLLLLPATPFSANAADLVLVRKSQARLYLMQDGRVQKSYAIALGRNPTGHKQQAGDKRTPEGRYVLDYKKSDSAFYKSIHISYPNQRDKLLAAARGVDPGGLIMIHGQKNGFAWLADVTQQRNWTDGCIAVTNAQMDEIWEAVTVGTPIEIRP